MTASFVPAAIAETASSWPFVRARELRDRLQGKLPEKGYVLFQTGYGPSGLPHIGTFGEVMRTTLVRQAFEALTGLPTKLFAVSDDFDALRKVPDNVPEREMLQQHIGRPLCRIPDPFGCCESFAHHNNSVLRGFLDRFGFDYNFISSAAFYAEGAFDPMLLRILNQHEAVSAIMLPTLREERAATYFPFMPISPVTGNVLQVRPSKIDTTAGTITFTAEDDKSYEVPVTGGRCKLQWKPDWAMRRTAFAVDFEIAGKDLTDSVTAADKITEVLGGKAPAGFIYELFLDESGGKISKSKGNGLSIETWLKYADPESLGMFMFPHPERAKRLHLDVVPRCVDDYQRHAAACFKQDLNDAADNPAYQLHRGLPPVALQQPLSFALLLNLAAAVGTDDLRVPEAYVKRYLNLPAEQALPDHIQRALGYALRYFTDIIKPTLAFRIPTDNEIEHLTKLHAALAAAPADADGDALQTIIFQVGREVGLPGADWFRLLYETLLGQSSGPRLGNFALLYTVPKILDLIDTGKSRKKL